MLKAESNATNRYRLTSPVPGGYAYWDINDMETVQSLVSIYKDFPNAEQEIRRLYAQLVEVPNER